METKENCKVLLKNNKWQKVKCYKFFQTDIERELAVHEDVDNKSRTSISDVQTGYGLSQFNKNIKEVTEKDINDTLNRFIKHYTIEGISKRFKEMEDRNKKD